jgi:hypothetical protein
MPARAARIGGVLLGILALGFFQQDARAQGLEDRPAGIFLGYTFTDLASPDPTGGRLHEQGLDFGVYVKQNHWLRWRADITGGGILGPGDDYELGGPEFTVHAGPAVFFAHALFGRGSVTGGLLNPTRTGFAMAFGGGVDLRVTSWFSLRLIDADYLPSHLTGPETIGFFGPPGPSVTSWDSNSRITFGVIFKVGKKS